MRSHPVFGIFCFVLGGAFFAAGALGRGSPGPLARLPLPADVVVPFVFWQLAIWCTLFGVFFLRSRGRYVAPQAKRSWNPLRAVKPAGARASATQLVPGRQ